MGSDVVRARSLSEQLGFLAVDLVEHPGRHSLAEVAGLLRVLAVQAEVLQDRCDQADGFWDRESREAAAGSYAGSEADPEGGRQ